MAIIEATGVFESPVDNVKLSKAGYRTQPNNSLLLIIITTKVVAVLEVQEEECRVHIRNLIIGLFVFSLPLSQPF